MDESWRQHLSEEDGVIRIAKHGPMQVDAMLVSNSQLLQEEVDSRSIQQLINTASMPGIVGQAWAMADWHFGYGFPIGGVVATDSESGEEGGAISPGGVGFDINCGVRVIATDLQVDDIPNLGRLASRLAGRIPAGASGKGGVEIGENDLFDIIQRGAHAAVDLGHGEPEDLENIENNGLIEVDEPSISERALKRGKRALGTLGSGNHFLELQVVDDMHEKKWGLHEGQVVAMIHSGSRGLGHQVCTDNVRELETLYKQNANGWYSEKFDWTIADRQLAAAPVHSKLGESYMEEMNCAANYAYANRSALTQRFRQALQAELGEAPETRLLQDISHNIARLEQHEVGGKTCLCCVHRKGATRALVDTPVLVPGDMGRASWILQGDARNQAFNSSCHGAGRVLSRTRARKEVDVELLRMDLKNRGIHVHAKTPNVMSEEAPQAYKDVDEVIRMTAEAKLARPVARVRPLAVIKG